jgi:hypothetical protein
MEVIRTRDRFAADARDEDERVFEAFLAREALDSTSLGRMSRPEVEGLRSSAMAARHEFHIPVTDRDYLYHGTSVARLALVAAEGLLVGDPSRSRWTRDVGIGTWSYGKVFFTDTVRNAMFYASEASRSRPVLLRVLSDALQDRRPDIKETDGSFYVEREVEPQLVEAWTRGRWKPLAAPVIKADARPDATRMQPSAR